MTLDDDSGAHEGNDEDNGDDGYGIESHGEQDVVARQVQLLLDLDRLGQIIARNRSNFADRCLACENDDKTKIVQYRNDWKVSGNSYMVQVLDMSVDNCAQLCTTVHNCAQRSHL